MRNGSWAVAALLSSFLGASAMAQTTPAPLLADYLKREDPSFAWKLEKNDTSPLGKVLHIDLQSQIWRDIPWKHQFRIYEPNGAPKSDLMILFITGGSSTSQYKPSDDVLPWALARMAGVRVAVLPQVPNQPLWGGRVEDDLISETFTEFLKTGEPDLPLLLPMVKSAVKAMDAAQAIGEERGNPVKRFVVTGASKRGWTTWLTGASDPRVAAIAPMVIPTLKMKEQTQHQLDVWGKYSEQIEDYTRRKLTDTFDTPEGSKLWHVVDPYFYIGKIEIPKLQINGTNDRYWTLDSMNLYWDDLKGPSYVVYLPNAGHGLDQNREYAVRGVAALAKHVKDGVDLPKLTWKYTKIGDNCLQLEIEAPGAKSIRVWTVEAPTRDFREAGWKALEPTAGGGPFTHVLNPPEKGWAAIVGDITYEIDGLEYHLSTTIGETSLEAK